MDTANLCTRDTDFVRENLLINYCLGDNDDLLIRSFMQNNHVDIRFDPQHFYFLMTGVHNKFLPQYTPKTFFSGVSNTLSRYEQAYALLDAHGYRGNCFLIKEDNSKQFGMLFSPTDASTCTPYVMAKTVDDLYRTKEKNDSLSLLHHSYISGSFVGPYSGYAQCNRAFHDARALNDLFFFGLRDQLITEDLRAQTAKPCDVTAITANVRALIHTVCCGTLKKALSQIDHLLDDLVAPSYSMTNFQAMYLAVDDLLSMLNTVYPDCLSLRRISLTQFHTLSAYKQYLYTTFEQIFSGLASVHRYPPTVLLALSFIHRNYTQPLSLAQLSEYIYANPSHLSSEFNASVGLSLSDYITRLRISKAKELLSSTDLPIGEIAKQCGFANIKYFRELFKKQTSLSAQQFRTQHP